MKPFVQWLNGGLRIAPIWSVYVIGLLWPVWLLYQAATGAMGVAPIEALEHALGKLGLQGLILGLAVTPLRAVTGVNLIRYRRAIGVLTFYVVAMHLLVWLVLDVQIPAEIWKDIAKRPYVTVGMIAFILMVPLAITSNNGSVRLLGAAWHRLHRLVYPAALCAGAHYLMLGKTWQISSVVYMGVIVLLLAWRLWNRVQKNSRRRAQRAQQLPG